MLRRMRLRSIRKMDRGSSKSYVWPPVWQASGALRDAGVLTNVRRIGHRLSLTVRFDRQDYVTLLDEWKPPPTIEAVEAALLTMIGKKVSRIGEVEIGSDVPLPRRDPTGY